MPSTNSFTESRASAFVESLAFARIESGVGLSTLLYEIKRIEAIHFKVGFGWPDFSGPAYDEVAFADDDARVDYLIYSNGQYQTVGFEPPLRPFVADKLPYVPYQPQSAVHADDWAFETCRVTFKSTPDPVSRTGYLESWFQRDVTPLGFQITRTESNTGVSDVDGSYSTNTHYNTGGLVGWTQTKTFSGDDTGLTCHSSWDDGAGQTFELTVAFSNPITNADVITATKDLYNGMTTTIANLADGVFPATNGKFARYDDNGDIAEYTTGTYFDFPAGTTKAMHGPLFSGAGEIRCTPVGIGASVTDSGVTAQDGLSFRLVDIEWQLKGDYVLYGMTYDQTGNDGAILTRTSEKLPYSPNIRLRRRCNPDNIDAGDTFTAYQVNTTAWYTTPDPDFPAPS